MSYEPPKTSIWMPLYVGDYMGDTIGLTLSQHGAYLLCLMAYWKKGGALSRQELKEICGKEVDRVSRFFISCDGMWYHKRVDEELAKMRHLSQSSREKAAKGVEARRRAGLLPPK